jgi:hypothetical protein
VRRFSTLVILSVIVCAGAAALLSFRSAVSYAGTATYLVPPGTGAATADTVTPYDAERIARTYTVVLAEDEQLLDALGSSIGRTRLEVSERLTAVALPSSSAVRLTYEGSSRDEVRTFFDQLTALVQSSTPPTNNIRPGSLRLLTVDDDIPRSGGGSWVAMVAGAIAGLLLGLGAASWLGRARPIVRTASDLREAGGPSVVDVTTSDPHSVGALVIRLLEGSPERASLAVVTTREDGTVAADELTRELRGAVRGLIDENSLSETVATIRWLPAKFGTGGERMAQDADRTLLVVPEGEDVRVVAACLSDLRDLRVTDVVLAVVHPSGSRASSGGRLRADAGQPVGSAGTS